MRSVRLLLLSHSRLVPQLVAAWILFLLTAGATYSVPPVMLKPIMDELGASQAQVSLFPAVFLLSKGVEVTNVDLDEDDDEDDDAERDADGFVDGEAEEADDDDDDDE